MYWDWTKLPESEHGIILAHIEAGRWQEVAKACEQHGVSVHCCCNIQGLQEWARWAVLKGIITNGIQPAQMAIDTGGDGNTDVG